MADKKQNNSKNDALYQWISYDLQRMKAELMKEMKISSIQLGALYDRVKADKDDSSAAIAQEIRYSYKQNQNIYDGIASMVKGEVSEKLNAVQEKLQAIEKLETILNDLGELKYSYSQLQGAFEGVSAWTEGATPKLDQLVEKSDYLEAIYAKVADQTCELSEEECAKIANAVDEKSSVHSAQVIEAINAIPVAENVDYTRIVEEVGDKMLELLNELKATETVAEVAEYEAIDYEKIAGDTAGKVVESLPYPDRVDYARIEAMLANVTATAPEIDYDRLAEAVASKVVVSQTAPEIDYDRLAEAVAEKITMKGMSADVVLDEEGIAKVAEAVAEKIAIPQAEAVDYDRVAEIVEEKLSSISIVCEYEPVEEVTEEVVEEAPVVEEVVEETIAEVVEETPAVEEAPAVEEVVDTAQAEAEKELAVAESVAFEEDMQGQLVDAETGLVVRLKRSFTAKLRQSEEDVKAYYSDVKNSLVSYKRINSNVSWHGDRFNLGRDTIAKINICGKTLCVYLALDPNDPELKSTVYHQKDVGNQKAYESTPFMVKVKSEAGAKKAVRLVAILADKLGAEKEENFQDVNYVQEYAYQSTKQLYEEGFIKATKEKKVDLSNF